MASRLTATGVYARSLLGRAQSAQGFYARRLKYGQLAFDIGANTGAHTRVMLRRGARVVAVEPQDDLADELEQLPGVTAIRAAVGDRDGEAVLHTASTHDGHATLNDRWVRVGEVTFDGDSTVQVTTLDALIARFGVPAVLKLDVEGFEDRALTGLSQPIAHVLFEIHRSLPEVASRALSRLEQLGRYEYRLMPHYDFGAGHDPWALGPVVSPKEVLAAGHTWADVYARLTG